MRIFVTGATGFIGSEIVRELIAACHKVLGLTRSDSGAKSLAAAGAEIHRGDLNDPESLRSGAAQSDGVIHTAFIHDFSKFKENAEIDKRAIEALGSVLAGSDRLLIVSGGLGPWALNEDVDHPAQSPFPRVSEQTALALAPQGVKAAVIRLPQVHNTLKAGLVTYMIAVAREKGVSAYVGDGLNRWPAAHVLDVAHLYKLAFEKHQPGARYHAIAESGVSLRDIAEAIGRGMKIPVVSISPEQANAHFGFLGMFAGHDLSAPSTLTQQRLGWRPTGPGLITDLNNMDYFEAGKMVEALAK